MTTLGYLARSTPAGTAAEVLFVQDAGLGAEGYRLSVTREGIRAAAETPAGALYAAQTLAQCLRTDPEGAAVPCLHIEDTPDFGHRGLFVEDKWGMDLMSLDDWKACIDELSRLKMNVLGVGAYGCWCVQYEGQVTEFLTLPIPEYPQLRTEKTIRYYSPTLGWQHLTYVPPLFEQDFFGDLVAYGRERNVVVRPHFNSLGHNTLIARLCPEVSARDRHGRPTGYGYCLSNSKTYEMVFRMYDGIVERYLRPHGVDFFHIGMDEVWPQIGADPQDPHRVVQPWCECPECASRSREDLLVEYTARVCAHLKEQGIRHISLWNDQFARHMNVIDRLTAAFQEHGVEENVIVHWWYYGMKFPESLRPELGLRRWVTPMTGYYFWMAYQSYVQNIHGLMQVGIRDGATGAESYCSYDRAFDREITCLAEYAWRNDAGDLDAFRRKYAAFLFGERREEGLRAFRSLEAVADFNDLHGFLRGLFYYPYTYVDANQAYPRSYPGEPLRRLLADVGSSRNKLAAARFHAMAARQGFLALAAGARRPDVVRDLAAEAHRLGATAVEFLLLLDAVDAYRNAETAADAAGRLGALDKARTAIAEAIRTHDALLRDIEAAKQKPLLPQTLRDLTALWTALQTMDDRLAAAEGAAQEDQELPGMEAVFLKQASRQ